MIVVPHPIPAINKIGACIVKTDIKEFTGPCRTAAEGHLRGTPFGHARAAMRTDVFFVFGHIPFPDSRQGNDQAIRTPGA